MSFRSVESSFHSSVYDDYDDEERTSKNATVSRRLLRWSQLSHCQGSFYCFCSLLFLGVCVLLASWWYKLSMRHLVCFSKSERGSRTVLVLVHTAFSHPVFVCVFRAEQCDVLRGSKFSPRNFLLPPNVYVSNFPVFSPKPSGFPLISAYIVLTFELCLCIGIDFNFCQISSPER